MEDLAYLEAQLIWARRRLIALDDIALKLQEMKSLAELARDHRLDSWQIDRLNTRMQVLQGEIVLLEDQSNQPFVDQVNN